MPGLMEPTQVGKREDLANIMVLLDAHETPVSSIIKKGTEPANTLFSWPVDDLDKPNTAGVPEGRDADTFVDPGANRELLSGRVMKQWRNPWVGDIAGTVSDVAGAGKGQEYPRAVVKALKELKRDQEAVLCSGNDSVPMGTVTAGVTRGLKVWIQAGEQGDLPVPARYRTPAASISTAATASLTEANVQAVLASIWSKTGKTKRLVGVVGSTLKRRFTSFSQYMPTVGSNTVVRSYSHGGESRKLVASVDLFVGDFGTIELIPSVFVGVDGAGAGRDDEGLLLDPDYLEIRYKRLPRHMPLQDAGGGKRGIVDQIYGLVVTQPQAHGKFQPA